MNILRLTFSALSFGVLTALASPVLAQDAAPVQIYNEQADARAELNKTLQQATKSRKQVLVVFGANWCGDCVALDRKFKSGALADTVHQRYEVLKVDVGRFKNNLDLAEQLGVSLKKGIPAAALLNAQGEALGATNGGELADARRMGDEAVLSALERLHKR